MAMQQRILAQPGNGLLDFGSLRLEVSPAAESALQKLPKKSLQLMAVALREWTVRAPVAAAKALFYVDYEDPDLRYVLIQFLLTPPGGLDIDEEVEFALKVGSDLSRTYADVLDSLPEKDKRRLFNGLMVDLTWPEDWDYVWGDDSSAELRS